MCSRQFDSTLKRDKDAITIITLVTSDPLSREEKNQLRRHVWNWSREQCIEAVSIKMEEKRNG